MPNFNVSKYKDNLEETIPEIEKLVKKIVSFDKEKRANFKPRIENGDPLLKIISNSSPLETAHKYFDMEHSNLHIGLVGLRHFSTIDTREDIDKISKFLAELKTIIDEFSYDYDIPIYLSQPPSRSGVYYKFFDLKPPIPPEYVNILPIISDSFTEQLKLENKIHSFMLGGSISRIYLPRENIPSTGDELKKILIEAIRTDVPLFRITPQKPPKEGKAGKQLKLD